eukprot:COSAG02_NODE_4072_length_5831_cov_3.030181_4_plen_125_part_00
MLGKRCTLLSIQATNPHNLKSMDSRLIGRRRIAWRGRIQPSLWERRAGVFRLSKAGYFSVNPTQPVRGGQSAATKLGPAVTSRYQPLPADELVLTNCTAAWHSVAWQREGGREGGGRCAACTQH